MNTNPAEFLIDLVSFNSSNSESLSESRSRITRLADTFLMYQNTTEYEKSQERIRSLVEMNFSSTSIVSVHDTHNKPSFDTSNNNNNNCKHLFNHKRNGSNLQSSSNNQLKKKHLFAATLFQPLKSIIQATVKSGQRFSLLLSRAYKQMARDMETNVVRLLVSGVLAVIVGSVYGKATGIRDLTMSSGPTRINILAQAVVNVGMMSVVKTLQILKREKVIVDRERQSGQYSAGEYLFAKSMIELPVDAIFASVSIYFKYTFIRVSVYYINSISLNINYMRRVFII